MATGLVFGLNLNDRWAGFGTDLMTIGVLFGLVLNGHLVGVLGCFK